MEGHVDKPAALAKNSRDVSEVASSGGAHSAASSDKVWLLLEESRYDAIASGRLRWEARPRDGTLPFKSDLRDPYFDWMIAKRGAQSFCKGEWPQVHTANMPKHWP